jgi:hypothetical protein
MNTSSISVFHRWLRLIFLAFALGIIVAPAARAGLNLEMNVIRYHQFGYYFLPNFGTNGTAPSVPFGDYYITSSGYPTNGASAFYHYDTNGFNQIGGGPYAYGDFDAMMHELTNGTWSIFVTNSVTTNVYYFNVTPNIVSNDLPLVSITFPADGSVNVTNQPNFTWQGPTNYNDLVVYEYNNSSFLPVTQTNWPSPGVLYQGINSFTPHYDRYSTTDVVSSVPLDNGLNPIFNWGSTAHRQDYATSQFTVGTVDPSGTSHTLVAHYTWDGTNGDGTASGADSSGNGYDMNFGGSFGGQGGVNSTTTAMAGPRAIQFHNGDGNSAGYVGWNPTPAPLLTALSGSFSVSCWIKTTQNFNYNGDPAYYGAGIISADNAGLANDVIPIALTGGQIAFNTGGDTEDVTLNSVAGVNDGNYHHIVVTRNQQTGQKIIYIDGVLDSFSSGTTNLLNDPELLTIGALSDARDSDASSTYYYNGYDGELDDVQIYSGVLSSNEVAQLFADPGSTVANGGGFSGGHKNVAHYTFDNSGNLGHDSSGNGNDMSGEVYWGPQHQFDTDATAGGGAIRFFGTDAIYPFNQALTNLNAVLAGSFTFSAWAKTTVTNGADYNNAFFGAVIFWAYNDHSDTNDTIPLAITGSKAAFTTRGGNSGISDNLHSLTSVNDGNYHLITVTRDQNTGEKKIYVDGNFETSQIGTTNSLNGNNYNLTIGGYAYILNTTPTTTNYSSYSGLLDDLQIYSGVLSGNDVAYLYNHPGSNVLDTTGQDFNTALNTTGLAWTTSGDSNWFVETTNTHDNVAAAQSGNVTGNQSSTLSVTVTGPGTLTFYWASQDDCDNFDYEFDIDGNYEDDIYCSHPWSLDGPFTIPSGQHTLTWTTYAYGDADPTEAGFLDQVNFGNSGPPLTFSLTIIRQLYASYQPFVTGQIGFYAFPGLYGPDTPISYDLVQSPNNFCSATFGPTNTGAGADVLGTFNELANDLTNGNWQLWVNKDTPQEKFYTFTISASAFSSNSLGPITITAPLDNTMGVTNNTPYHWTGPATWSNLTVTASQIRSGTNYNYATANLPVTAVNWPAGPVLAPGTNFFSVEYDKFGVTNFTVSAPYPQWSVGDITYQSYDTAGFLVSGTIAVPATLLNPLNAGATFQFQFLSQTGFNHAVLYSTNLVTGNWQTYSNLTGDGTVKTISMPISLFNGSKQGFVRVSTQ